MTPLVRWNRRLSSIFFCKSTINKDKPPPFFEANSDAMKAFMQFGNENLNSLSVEKMYDYVYEHDLFPKLLSNLGLEINGLVDYLSDKLPTLRSPPSIFHC
jgi:hypothetical protein